SPVLEPSRVAWNRRAAQATCAPRLASPVTPACLLLPGPVFPFLPAPHSARLPISRTEQNRASLCARAGAHRPTDMAAAAAGCNLQEEASGPGADLYAVLGLNRECTDAELRGAYRRLAMIWHPDRCSASGSSARVEEAKERFQEIQGAYSVLSDSNKRLLYDVGVYDSEDDEADLSGMGDFLGEMADMMSQATPTETFEELQQLFVDMFQDDLDPDFFSGLPPGRRAQSQSPPSTSSSPQPPLSSSSSTLRPPNGRNNAKAHPPSRNGGGVGKWGSPAVHSAVKRPRPGQEDLDLDLGLSGFCFMVSETRQQAPAWTCEVGGGGDRRSGRKQRQSTSRDVSGDGVPRSFRQSQTSRPLWQ
ncbi:unnamed protein product, partial [Urochloa humidicola]